MKRIILLTLICAAGLFVYAQKVIENPGFHAATSEKISITRIELQDTCTVLHFSMTDNPGGGFNIPPESYIQPSAGGNKLYVTRAEGLKIGESVAVPASGKLLYKLFFPRVDPSLEMIDFGEDSENGSWFFYNLELVPQKHVSIFPEAIEGNWFRTDGSREWVYGFQSPVVMFKSQLFESVKVSDFGKGYQLSLTKDGKTLTIYTQPASDNSLLIGTDPKKLERYSREPEVNPDYILPGDDEYKLPVIKPGTAVYSGYLKGYLPRMGKTGMVYVSNVIDNNQEPILIDIAGNGTFSVSVPMDYPVGTFIRILGFNKTVFLEPGKSLFTFFDLTATDKSSKSGNCLFMGGMARMNADLAAVEPVSVLNFTQMLENIGKMTMSEYKAWMLDLGRQKEDSLNRIITGYPICKKALQVKKLDITSSINENILSYNMYKQYYNQDPSKPSATASEKPDSSFYFFLPADEMNNQLSLLSQNYYSMMNRLIFCDVVRPKKISFYQPLIDSVSRMGLKISDMEKQMLRDLASGMPLSGTGAVSKEVADTWTRFSRDNKDLIGAVSLAVYHEQVASMMKKYFRIEPGLVTDIVLSQRLSGMMTSSLEPLNTYEIQLVNQRIITPEIRKCILAGSKELEKKITALKAENQAKTGYVVHEAPKEKADALFASIIGQHKGKLLFIDYWATWCSPCKEGILRMKPLKEEYAGKDIEFVYITGPSSPEKTYNLMVPDIRGQHYRVDKDGWNYLCSRFKIDGIPHYMLVDKAGKIISEDLGSVAHSNVELKRLFDKHL